MWSVCLFVCSAPNGVTVYRFFWNPSRFSPGRFPLVLGVGRFALRRQVAGWMDGGWMAGWVACKRMIQLISQ